MIGPARSVAMLLAAVVRAAAVPMAGALAAVASATAVPAAAQESALASPARQSVLVAPVQGSDELRMQHADRVASAVRRALEARGHDVTVAQESLGHAVVACQTPECVEQALDAAGVAFAIVPALWSRTSGGEEVTLTLLQRSGRSLNASGAVGDDLPVAAADLIDELLAKRPAAGTPPPPAQAAATAPERARATATAHPHAWKAGPIILITGGAAALVSVGVAAGVKSDNQQLDGAAVAAWSAVGAAAIAGGIAWWVVGEKQRRKRSESASAASPAVCLRPTGIDLKLRF
jgi:hypothetical protein